MTFMRTKMGYFLVGGIAVVLALFVLEPLLQQGSAIFGASSRTEVGSIDGEAIKYDQFNAKVEQTSAQFKQQYGGVMNPQMQAMAVDQAWQSEIATVVLGKEFERVGLTVSADELFDLVQGKNPSPLITQYFGNPQTGEFDRAAVISSLKSRNQNPQLAQQWLLLESEIEKQALQQKYTKLISNSVYVSSLEANDEYLNRNKLVNFKYVNLDYSSILDANVKLEDADYKAYYEENKKLINVEKSVIRLGLIQWQMRPLSNLEALFEQAEFFIDAVSGYGSDFALFPELFTAPLMADYNHLSEAEAIKELAKYTEAIRKKMQEFAISYNINIITGSMPFLEDDHVYNVGFLCRRDGTSDMYRKIHITPNEVFHWGITGGNTIQTFDTDCGKIGIVICYDVEFPELSRLMADQGMNILFVPFLTDTQNGYTRVRHCAQARAIENECYVAITGCVGNLPKVNNMDIQYAQAAVFTPSDFAFPSNGVKAEATPNTEMTLIADVDIDVLKELHEHGSVQIMKDRRHDLYKLKKVKQ